MTAPIVRQLAVLALALGGAVGCHAPRFTGVDRVVRSGHYEIRTDAGHEIEGEVAPLLDRIAWRLETRAPVSPSPTAAVEPYRAVIFERREDYDAYRVVHGADDHAHAFYCKFGREIVLPAETALRGDAPAVHVLAHEVAHQVIERSAGGVVVPVAEAEGAAELWPIRAVLPEDLPPQARAAWAWLGALRELRAVLHAGLRSLYGKRLVRDSGEPAWAEDDYPLHLALAMYLEAKRTREMPTDQALGAWARDQAALRLENGGAPEAEPLIEILRAGRVRDRLAAREAIARTYLAVLSPAFSTDQLDLAQLEEEETETP